MNSKIIKGPCNNLAIPTQSIGKLFYNKLKTINSDKIAMVDVLSGKEITYGNLCNLSIKLATEMIKIGVEKGNVVTILSENNWKSVVTTLATFYAGASVNFLNPDYKLGELSSLLSICSPSLIFLSRKCIDTVLALKKELKHCRKIISFDDSTVDQVLNIDCLLEGGSNDTKFEPTEVNSPKDIAIILTSSGTTGLPKCVPMDHRNVRNSLINFGDSNFFDMKPEEVVPGYLPFFHMYGNVVFLWSIFFGAKLIILKSFKPDIFLQTIENYKISTLFATPIILSILAKSPLVDSYNLTSVKDVIYGSSSTTACVEELVSKRLNVKSLRQGYGLTETGVISLLPKNNQRPGSVGKLTNTFQLKVACVKTGQPLGANKEGELRVKGEGVIKGYLHNDEATLAAFDEEGFLKSGDLGYYDEEEFIYVVDRLKDIIKCKGFSVSPVELEQLLMTHSAVAEAAVVGIYDEIAGELPLAFIVKEPNTEVSEAEIISFISERVCRQKHLHGGVRFVESIPKTAMGKVCRPKLRQKL